MADELFTSLDELLAYAKRIILTTKGTLSELAIRMAVVQTLAGRTYSVRQLAAVTAEAIRELDDLSVPKLDRDIEKGEPAEAAGVEIIRAVLLVLICEDEEIVTYVTEDHGGIINAATGMISFPIEVQSTTPGLDALIVRAVKKFLEHTTRGIESGSILFIARSVAVSISPQDRMGIVQQTANRFAYINDEIERYPDAGPILRGLIVWRLVTHPDVVQRVAEHGCTIEPNGLISSLN